nr:VOC family protein [Paenibacillus kobensis]
MPRTVEMLLEKGVRLSKSSISDGFHCVDFFDSDGNRIGLVGAEKPAHIDLEENIAVCATFLAVRNIDRAIEWYSDTFGLTFKRWSFTGGAGYISNTDEHNLTIKYAAADYLQRDGMVFAETPNVNRLAHTPYVLQSSNAFQMYKELFGKGVSLSPLNEENGLKSFEFIDIEGNNIGIVEVVG